MSFLHRNELRRTRRPNHTEADNNPVSSRLGSGKRTGSACLDPEDENDPRQDSFLKMHFSNKLVNNQQVREF